MSKHYVVITAMNRKIYDETGKAMIESFSKFWEEPVRLIVYWQGDGDDLGGLKDTISNGRVTYYSSFMMSPELTKFVDRHKDRADQKNPLELHHGAVRFSYKTFAEVTTLQDFKRGGGKVRVVWLDADTVTFAPVTVAWLDTLLPEGKFVSFLGREDNYSECGFLMYDTAHLKTKEFADTWEQLYVTDEVFNLPQWHDSFVFDHVRRKVLKPSDWHNLTPLGRGYQHVWLSSELATKMDHMKGNRKAEGKSRLSDLDDFDHVPAEIIEHLDPSR